MSLTGCDEKSHVNSRRLLQVRRSEQVTPAQRNKALEKLAKSIKLREDQAKKLNKNGGGNKGHDHMLDVLKVCPRQRLLIKPDRFCTRTETELTGFVSGTPLGSAAMVRLSNVRTN
jgi:hypothetical protein